MDELLSLRFVNALLASVALVLFTVYTVRVWRELNPSRRLLSEALALLLVTGVYGSVEAQLQGAPLGFRTYMATVAYLWTVGGVLVAQQGPIYRRRK